MCIFIFSTKINSHATWAIYDVFPSLFSSSAPRTCMKHSMTQLTFSHLEIIRSFILADLRLLQFLRRVHFPRLFCLNTHTHTSSRPQCLTASSHHQCHKTVLSFCYMQSHGKNQVQILIAKWNRKKAKRKKMAEKNTVSNNQLSAIDRPKATHRQRKNIMPPTPF